METKNDLYWLWLDQIRGVSLTDKYGLLQKYGSPQSIYLAEDQVIIRFIDGRHAVDTCFPDKNLDPYKRILDRHQQLGIKMLTPEHPLYRPGCGFVCFYKGSRLQVNNTAAVIGTRKCSADGYYQTEKICQQLFSEGICVNSGLALGIDFWAHSFMLRMAGRTQAFLARGLDCCYPSVHQDLFEQIMSDGAVLSPFPAGSRPLRHHFWIRNKWMACLSDQVIVVEAPRHSGALITARHALELGRKLYAVKPHLRSDRCAGNTHILKNGAEAWPKDCWSDNAHPVFTEPVLRRLRNTPQTFDQLRTYLRLTRHELEAKLLQLEGDHWIICHGNGLWRYNGW